jgi:hypothetical protein
MSKELYRYRFNPRVPLGEVEGTLLLAVLGAEALHGEAVVRLDAAHLLDPDRRSCVIDVGTEAGDHLNRLFANYLRHEFGEDAFEVQRIEGSSPNPLREEPAGA